jgi:hypothetical protein
MAAISLDPKSDRNSLLGHEDAEHDDELVIVARLRCNENGVKDGPDGDTVPFAKWRAYAVEVIDPKRKSTAVDLLEDLYAKRTGKQPLDLGGGKS